MSISFTCPHCGKSTLVEDRFAGQTGPCAACGKPVTIPGPGAPRSSGAGIGIGIAVLAVCGVSCLCIIPILIALLLPAVQAAREAARRTEAANDLKLISLALLNYESTYGSFPPPYVADASGKPLYSWRVLILPFMEQNALYEQFDKTKAWDDPANIGISNMKLDNYQSPSDGTLSPNGCSYFVLVGPGTVFPSDQKVKVMDITDGTSNTVTVIETMGISGSWAAPIDPAFDSVNPKIGRGPGEIQPVHPGGTQMAFGDGSVRFLSENTDPETMRRLLLRNDGQPVMIP